MLNGLSDLLYRNSLNPDCINSRDNLNQLYNPLMFEFLSPCAGFVLLNGGMSFLAHKGT